MQELQLLQPEMKKIQERYKEDSQRMNQEMMKFYQENKVNPLGSCLPLLLQLPFFISLFYLLRERLRSQAGHRRGNAELPASSPTWPQPLTDEPRASSRS